MTFTPAPKPEKRVREPKVKSPRKPIKRGGRIKATKRSPEEYARIYGSKERREWVASLPCVTTWRDDWWKFRGPNLYGASGTACKGKMENAHTETGGTGRKADAKTIVPACHHHHAEMHRGVETFATRYGVDLEKCSAEIERLWQLHIKHRNAA